MEHATLPALGAGLSTAHLAAISYLARYQGQTHALYTRYLGEWFAWCERQGLDPLEGVVRGHVEMYIRYRLERGNKASTVGTALAPVKGFFKFATIDGLIDRDPATYAALPKVHDDMHAKSGMDRRELSTFLFVSERISAQHYALAHLLGLLALRVSEACSLDVTSYRDTERGHRVLRFVGKGSKPATVPVTIPVLRALDAAKGDRATGPLLLTRAGQRLDRHTAAAMVRTITKHAGVQRRMSPHSLRRSAITAALDAGVQLRDVQQFARHSDPRTTSTYDLARGSLDRHATHILTAYVAGG